MKMKGRKLRKNGVEKQNVNAMYGNPPEQTKPEQKQAEERAR